MLGLRVGKPGSQGKLDVVRVQQEPGRPRWGQESNYALTPGRCGGTNHTLGSRDNQGTCPEQRPEGRWQMRGMEQKRMGSLVGRGPSYGAATASCSASGQPSQPGMVPSHRFVLLCCWRAPPCSSAMAERQTAVPRSPPHPSVSGSFSPCPASSAITGGHGDGWGSHAGDRSQTQLRCCLLPPQGTTCHHILV